MTQHSGIRAGGWRRRLAGGGRHCASLRVLQCPEDGVCGWLLLQNRPPLAPGGRVVSALPLPVPTGRALYALPVCPP